MGTYEFISIIVLSIAGVIIAYLRFRTPPCKHDWEILKEIKVYKDEEYDMPAYSRYHLRCKKCGEVKVKNMH